MRWLIFAACFLSVVSYGNTSQADTTAENGMIVVPLEQWQSGMSPIIRCLDLVKENQMHGGGVELFCFKYTPEMTPHECDELAYLFGIFSQDAQVLCRRLTLGHAI